MPLNPNYTSKAPDENGIYSYSPEEHGVWKDLFTRQIAYLQDHACQAYLDGVARLGLSALHVPQVTSLDAKLAELTGAGVKGVAALIPQDEFSTLLSNRKFPVATFIRTREDMEYLEEPDIFHEVFGHSPMLTNEPFCQFMERFGALALNLPKEHLKHLFRLFWFTIEFGMIRENGALKAFGAGIMSSPSEAEYATSGEAEMVEFDLMTVLRTPYRIDIVQPVYFVIDSFEQLVDTLDQDIEAAIVAAKAAGDLPARFDLVA
ncbi:phenylalanine 4-monooxygenase [uncultured Litoreibacter sp.]|uniref:phenylalanine 4-monooxygenase n=1 Tax=uncultured Litoreibacter sp. TaxID=1392394 RepID=UPI0026098FB5|nr:phenylalanine 4-monooxygenase [uncultured Litoreibacter sp.]